MIFNVDKEYRSDDVKTAGIINLPPYNVPPFNGNLMRRT
jgi:hypothetical protein